MNRRTLLALSVALISGVAIGAGSMAAASGGGSRTGAPTTRSVDAASTAAAASSASSASPAPISYVGKLQLSPKTGAIGSQVQVAGEGFSPGANLSIVWQGFTGHWNVKGDDPANFGGRGYTEVPVTVATAKADSSGAFQASFTVPDGFGFAHDVRVVQDGVIRNQATFSVKMEVSISPRSGPPGTPITVDVKGIGVTPLVSSWELSYDNAFTGWISAVTTEGHARFVMPATGAPGPHVLRIVHGSFTFPYLNMQQSPDPTRPTFSLTFDVTAGMPVLPPAAASQAIVSTKATADPGGQGPRVWLDRAEATVGSQLHLRGAGLTPSTSLEVGWQTQVGVDTQMIGGSGAARPDTEIKLGSVAIDANGAFDLTFIAPKDKGGAHPVVVRREGAIVATTSVRVRPSASALSTSSGPAGTDVVIQLDGIDDTDTGKIFMLTYDNVMAGYACSVTAGGQITIHLPATGEVGWHFIDLYPGIYKGKDIDGLYNYRIPQLTYGDDHPGEKLPAFHFAFQVTP